MNNEIVLEFGPGGFTMSYYVCDDALFAEMKFLSPNETTGYFNFVYSNLKKGLTTGLFSSYFHKEGSFIRAVGGGNSRIVKL